MPIELSRELVRVSKDLEKIPGLQTLRTSSAGKPKGRQRDLTCPKDGNCWLKGSIKVYALEMTQAVQNLCSITSRQWWKNGAIQSDSQAQKNMHWPGRLEKWLVGGREVWRMSAQRISNQRRSNQSECPTQNLCDRRLSVIKCCKLKVEGIVVERREASTKELVGQTPKICGCAVL
jgi:hypothetical protein